LPSSTFKITSVTHSGTHHDNTIWCALCQFSSTTTTASW